MNWTRRYFPATDFYLTLTFICRSKSELCTKHFPKSHTSLKNIVKLPKDCPLHIHEASLMYEKETPTVSVYHDWNLTILVCLRFWDDKIGVNVLTFLIEKSIPLTKTHNLTILSFFLQKLEPFNTHAGKKKNTYVLFQL